MQNPVKIPLDACQVQAENYLPMEIHRILALVTQWLSQKARQHNSPQGQSTLFDYFLTIQPQASSGKDKGTVNSTVL